MSVYLDYNASGLVRPEVQAVMAKALADNGNPSAVHAAGRRARARVETARAQVAELVVHIDGLPDARIPLLAQTTVEKGGFLQHIGTAAKVLYARFVADKVAS